MRYATFSTANNPTPRLGIVLDDHILEVRTPTTMLDLVRLGPIEWARLAKAGGAAASQGYDLRSIRWHAPIPRPTKNVFCLGRNYAEHVREATRARGQDFKLPTHPIFFKIGRAHV